MGGVEGHLLIRTDVGDDGIELVVAEGRGAVDEELTAVRRDELGARTVLGLDDLAAGRLGRSDDHARRAGREDALARAEDAAVILDGRQDVLAVDVLQL